MALIYSVLSSIAASFSLFWLLSKPTTAVFKHQANVKFWLCTPQTYSAAPHIPNLVLDKGERSDSCLDHLLPLRGKSPGTR